MQASDVRPGELKRATMRDVARRAGVSHMTVSRVINRDKAVSEPTRRQVERAIEELRFVPNPAARALSGGEPVEVALLHRFPNPGSLGDFLVHLVQHCAKTHSSLFVREVTGGTDFAAIADELKERGTRAVLLSPPLPDERSLTAALEAQGMSIVGIGATRRSSAIPSVGIDEREAARALTEHLLQLGHRRIAFIKGNPVHASSEARLSGYLWALKQAGIAVDERLVVDGMYTYQSGLGAADKLLSLDARPTAVFASNDDMAAAVISSAHQRGIAVPAELSVCGFDDAPIATTIWPALTTVRRPTREMTEAAFSILFDQYLTDPDSPREPRQILFDYALVQRQSDAPPTETGGQD